jgi:hypothetical protein
MAEPSIDWSTAAEISGATPSGDGEDEQSTQEANPDAETSERFRSFAERDQPSE